MCVCVTTLKTSSWGQSPPWFRNKETEAQQHSRREKRSGQSCDAALCWLSPSSDPQLFLSTRESHVTPGQNKAEAYSTVSIQVLIWRSSFPASGSQPQILFILRLQFLPEFLCFRNLPHLTTCLTPQLQIRRGSLLPSVCRWGWVPQGFICGFQPDLSLSIRVPEWLLVNRILS